MEPLRRVAELILPPPALTRGTSSVADATSRRGRREKDGGDVGEVLARGDAVVLPRGAAVDAEGFARIGAFGCIHEASGTLSGSGWES